ncbi:MAG: prolyl aminopeptidase [Alphaproteobacteria bacterium]|nr:prolyl aminopeptidase [Rhodospirillales bacterium]MCW9045439.1 prolyl aminopeptidase [Alphaproteobacteria bacterium]
MDTSQSQQDLYPPIEPYDCGRLDVDDVHSLYWETSGNPKGVPVVFLHGGPGAGCQPIHRRFFDPKHYRIILFDQRGCGRSQPLGDLHNNTTPHLVSDMELIREHLGVERWINFGGSWGSTLALAYGISHPERCLGFVLRGIFLCRDPEIEWFIDGVKRVFPEAWRRFAHYLPENERGDLLKSYYHRLTHPDPLVHGPAARIWCQFESSCSTLQSNQNYGDNQDNFMNFGIDRDLVALARLESHYLINKAFMGENHILASIEKLSDHPAEIVQGRYDMVCPIATADDLSQAWPKAKYTIISNCGHSALESGIRLTLVSAMERMKSLQS